MADNPVRVKRLSPSEREETEEVWLTCRECGADIPPSARNHAYCDSTCKEAFTGRQMGFPR